MPTGDQIANEAAANIASRAALTAEEIRSRFSALLHETERECYAVYLGHEALHGETVVGELVAEAGTDPIFPTLDRLFLSIGQSRKARAGITFESTIRGLFRQCGYPFEEQCVVNGKPDFLLPSESHYRRFATDCIIFTAKRTIRERWRQIATEGTRGKALYLATIDHKVTAAQSAEMLENRIYLVVPADSKGAVPAYSAAPNVISFEDFFTDHLDPAMERWRRSGVITSSAS